MLQVVSKMGKVVHLWDKCVYLKRTRAGSSRTIKRQQKEISPNHEQAICGRLVFIVRPQWNFSRRERNPFKEEQEPISANNFATDG